MYLFNRLSLKECYGITAVSQGPAYKDKLAAMDTEILTLQEQLSKLKAQKQVAQSSAHSAEFLHSNIRFAIKHLDQAPPEAQKALLHALIKSITIYDDRVELKMYVGQPFEAIVCNLPQIAHNSPENTPTNGKTPQKTCEVTATIARGANERPRWLPRMDSNHEYLIQSQVCYHYTTGQKFL